MPSWGIQGRLYSINHVPRPSAVSAEGAGHKYRSRTTSRMRDASDNHRAQSLYLLPRNQAASPPMRGMRISHARIINGTLFSFLTFPPEEGYSLTKKYHDP